MMELLQIGTSLRVKVCGGTIRGDTDYAHGEIEPIKSRVHKSYRMGKKYGLNDYYRSDRDEGKAYG